MTESAFAGASPEETPEQGSRMTTEQQPNTEPESSDGLADQADAPVLGIGDDVRPGPETTDEPEAGATEPTD